MSIERAKESLLIDIGRFAGNSDADKSERLQEAIAAFTEAATRDAEARIVAVLRDPAFRIAAVNSAPPNTRHAEAFADAIQRGEHRTTAVP